MPHRAGGKSDPFEKSPESVPSTPRSINVITYNVFGLKFIAKYRRERLEEVGRRLAHLDSVPEIVGLQECWTQEDYNSIRNQTRHILPYAKYYFSGIFGGGLAILSRWPIEDSSMYRYPLNGRPTAFWRGDWYVGKGVACASIRIGGGPKDIVEVFCTHLHAPYESEPNDSYICHRTAQAWEIAKLMRGAAERGHLVLGLGDFNMLPLSFAHRLIEARAPVKDAWRLLHPQSSVGPASHPEERSSGKQVPTARFNLTENGAASDGVFNTWRWSQDEQKKLFKGEKIDVEDETPDPRAKRLDYIFVSCNSPSSGLGAPAWHVKDIKVGMTERHPTIGCSLSDHFSIEAILTQQTGNCSPPLTDNPASSTSLDSSFYGDVLTMVHTYTERERQQRRLRLTHFGSSVLVSIGSLTAVWWSPHHFVCFLLTLLSTLGLGAGIVDGLIGGLFIGSELRALKEFEWEIDNARKLSMGSGDGQGHLNSDQEQLSSY